MDAYRCRMAEKLGLVVLTVALVNNAGAQFTASSYASSYYNPQVFNIAPNVWQRERNVQPSPNSLYPWTNDRPNQTLQSPNNCGDTFQRRCEKSRYRSFDGSCNNLYHPTWGMANTRYSRLLPPNYADGLNEPTRSVTGASLPLSRAISYTLFPPQRIEDPIWTLGAMQWGQIIAHDMALIDGATQSIAHPTKCCSSSGELLHSSQLDDSCYPIIIPYDDPVYSKANIRCRNFVRAVTDLDRGCSIRRKAAEQLTTVTHFLDLSILYGSDENTARSLRTGIGGRLQIEVRNNRQWMPSASAKNSSCDTTYDHEVCYTSGDSRVNQNPGLAIMHTLLLREHNRIASTLAHLNPHWTDETTFQEARRILIAEHQYISYYEWLPIFLGKQGTYGNKILYKTQGYVDDYDASVDPSVLNEHSTGAFRYFHSLIAGYLNTVGEARYYSPHHALRLSDHFNRPGIIEEGNNLDDLTRGMASQPQTASDQFFDEEITVYLFRNKDRLGEDLRATDIQRNRDHGLGSYNAAREACGMPCADDFEDFLDLISEENVQKLSDLYASPDDVDLSVGGALERHVPGTLAGPTFLCIMNKQFLRTRVGDRYWFENSDPQFAFTLEQLAEIKKSSIARLFCDNGDRISSMQRRAFEQVSDRNPLMDCADVPGVDLSLWKDYAPEFGTHSHFDYRKK